MPQNAKGYLGRWWVLTLVCSVVIFCVAVGFFPELFPPYPKLHRENRWRPQCLSNEKQILIAMAMYADRYGCRYPVDSTNPTLVGSMQLLSNVLSSADVLHCPGDRRPGARAQADFKKLMTLNISYSYVPNVKWHDTSDSPILLDRIDLTTKGSAWPNNGNHQLLESHESAGGNVGFDDGHVQWFHTLPTALKDNDGKEVVLSP